MNPEKSDQYCTVTTYLNYQLIKTPGYSYNEIIKANVKFFSIIGQHQDKMYNICRKLNLGTDEEKRFKDNVTKHLCWHVDNYINKLNAN